MWTPCSTKKERIEKIRSLIMTNDKAVCRGIVAIYKRQTESEKCNESTQVHNGIGFNSFDAQFMSSLAKQLLDGKPLSAKQMAIGRNKIVRYSKQLADIAESRERT